MRLNIRYYVILYSFANWFVRKKVKKFIFIETKICTTLLLIMIFNTHIHTHVRTHTHIHEHSVLH